MKFRVHCNLWTSVERTFDRLLGLIDVGQEHIDHSAGLLAAAIPRVLGEWADHGVQHRRRPVESGCIDVVRCERVETKRKSQHGIPFARSPVNKQYKVDPNVSASLCVCLCVRVSQSVVEWMHRGCRPQGYANVSAYRMADVQIRPLPHVGVRDCMLK